MSEVSVQAVFLISAALFASGVYGVLARRNLLIILMSVELMLNAANLMLAGMSRLHAADGGGSGGQVLILMSMAVAACEVAVGLSIVIALFRHTRSVDVSAPQATRLRG